MIIMIILQSKKIVVKLFYADDFAVYAVSSIYWYLGKKQAPF